MVYALNDLKNPKINLGVFFSTTLLHELGFRSYKALTLKAVQNKTAVLDLLKARGFGIESKSTLGATLLHFAALAGHEDAVTLLLSLGYVNEKTTSGASLGHYAAQGGHVALIEHLVSEHFLKPEDIHDTDHSGAGFILYAARGGHIEAIQKLMVLGLDKNQKNECGAGALHYAVLNAPIEAIKALIETLGYNPRALDNYGASALHQAALFGKASLVELFIQHYGLNPDELNGDEETLKDLADQSKCPLTIALCSNTARLQQLYQSYGKNHAVATTQAVKIESAEQKTTTMYF